jgi:hypothetical protein
MWKNILYWGQVTDENMAHWHCLLDTSGYKYTHSGYVIPIAFQLQQWLKKCPSQLPYT